MKKLLIVILTLALAGVSFAQRVVPDKTWTGNGSDGSQTICTQTQFSSDLTCTTTGGRSNESAADEAARQKRNADEIAGYAALGAGATTLAIILIKRHRAKKQAQEWGQQFCAQSPELESCDTGEFHGFCKRK